jgi:putative endonuclease
VPDPRHLLGQQGEEMAATWLTARGWSILARRWRSAAGELDLVALDPERVLVAVEVKLRRGSRAGEPAEAIDRRRLLRLRTALGQFRLMRGEAMRTEMRIDLVAISRAPDGRWRMVHHRAIDAW